MRSDLEHRGRAVLDPLTGLLNRNALEDRAEELTAQSELSGEEFLVMLPGASETHAAAVAEELREAIAAERFAHGLRMTMSLGVAASKRGGPFDRDRVFEAADTAMHAAKLAGRRWRRAGSRGRATGSARPSRRIVSQARP